MGKSIIIGIIAVIVIAGGGYLILHKSPAKTSSTSSYSTPPAAKNTTKTTASSAIIQTKTDSKLGQYLANGNGQALYTYGADTSGVSNCTGGCLSVWPAYAATATVASLPANVKTMRRTDDGATQYTYKGLPLYTFTSDSAGQVTGNGVGNFHVAKP